MTKVLIVDAGSRIDIAKELMRHYFDDWCHAPDTAIGTNK